MKRYLSSFLSFLKRKKFPNRDDLLALRQAPLSLSKTILFFGVIIVVGLFLHLLLAISNLATIEVPDYGGTIVSGVIGAPKYINPLLATSETDLALTSLVYVPLVKIEAGTLVPVVAKECLVSPDGKSYQCTLPEKIKFSNKSLLTSSDVLFSYTTKRALEVAKDPQSDWKNISVETPNSTVVHISTTGNKDALREKLSLGIVSKSIWESVTIESMKDSVFNLSPVGAGPFKVDSISYSNGLPNIVALIPNPHFAQNKPYLSHLIIRSYNNQLDLLSALRNHQIDSTGFLKNEYIDQTIKNNFSITPIPGSKSVALWANQKELSGQVAQKLASISNNIDRSKILDNIESGYGIPLYVEETSRSSKAPNKPSEVTISIAVQKDADLIKSAEMLSLALQEFGILSTIQVFDQGTFIDQVTSGRFPFILATAQTAIDGYQRLIPLYTKSFVHTADRDVHMAMPELISSSHESFSMANLWYVRTDKVWKWFTHK